MPGEQLRSYFQNSSPTTSACSLAKSVASVANWGVASLMTCSRGTEAMRWHEKMTFLEVEVISRESLMIRSRRSACSRELLPRRAGTRDGPGHRARLGSGRTAPGCPRHGCA